MSWEYRMNTWVKSSSDLGNVRFQNIIHTSQWLEFFVDASFTTKKARDDDIETVPQMLPVQSSAEGLWTDPNRPNLFRIERMEGIQRRMLHIVNSLRIPGHMLCEFERSVQYRLFTAWLLRSSVIFRNIRGKYIDWGNQTLNVLVSRLSCLHLVHIEQAFVPLLPWQGW